MASNSQITLVYESQPRVHGPWVVNPRRMREGYGSRSVCLSVC